MKLKGKVHKYASDVDTDAIIPACHLNLTDGGELAVFCMEHLDPGFREKVRPGDMIVASTNFGCGSSREHAPLAIKSSGISCVIAQSFARIFHRNAINIGLPILECEEAVTAVDAGDELEVELDTGRIRNLTRGGEYQAKPYPDFMLELIRAGGLVEYTKEKIKAGR